MANVVFSQKYDLLGDTKYRYVVDAIAGSNLRTTVLIYLPQLVFGRLDKKLFPASIKARNAFLSFIGKLLHERYHRPGLSRKDVFSTLLKVQDADTGKGLQPEQVGAESTTLVVAGKLQATFFCRNAAAVQGNTPNEETRKHERRKENETKRHAGSDTTATALSSVFFYLSHYPHAYRNAQDEVCRIFTSRDDIRIGQKLQSCTYLRACIDESMRVTPPIGASLFREAGPGGVTVDGYYFPQGIDVGTSIYSIHHNPAYFPYPHRFMPERWCVSSETGTSPEQLRRALSALNPFSVGPRSCIGKSMAMAELMLTMASVLWLFDFRLVDGPDARIGEGDLVAAALGRRNPDEFQLSHGGVTSVKNGPVLQFMRRRVEGA